MVSCTEHIDGRAQTLETYMRVLDERSKAFFAYVKAEYDDEPVDECEWDDIYSEWLEQDQTLDGAGVWVRDGD